MTITREQIEGWKQFKPRYIESIDVHGLCELAEIGLNASLPHEGMKSAGAYVRRYMQEHPYGNLDALKLLFADAIVSGVQQETRDAAQELADVLIQEWAEYGEPSLSFAAFIQDNCLKLLADHLASRAPEPETEIEKAISEEWKRIKPSEAAQRARSSAYLVEWDDFNIPEYIVAMMDIAAQRAINSLAPPPLKERELADAQMLLVKACEHIAVGDEGWEKLRNECPSTAAVAALRDAYVKVSNKLAYWEANHG